VDKFVYQDPLLITPPWTTPNTPTGSSVVYDAFNHKVTITAGSTLASGSKILSSPSPREDKDYGFMIVKNAKTSPGVTQNVAALTVVDSEGSFNSESLQAWPLRFPTTWGYYDTATATALRSTVPTSTPSTIEMYVNFTTDTIVVYRDWEPVPSLVYTVTGTTSSLAVIGALSAINVDAQNTLSVEACWVGYMN